MFDDSSLEESLTGSKLDILNSIFGSIISGWFFSPKLTKRSELSSKHSAISLAVSLKASLRSSTSGNAFNFLLFFNVIFDFGGKGPFGPEVAM